jgi:hypothetical protein
VFSLNGVPLDNPARGWLVRDLTSPLTSIDTELAELAIAGRDGVQTLDQRPRNVGGPLPFVIEAPRSGLPALRTVLRQRPLTLTWTEYPELEALVDHVSRFPQGIGNADEVVEVNVMFRIPGVYWRDIAESTSDPVVLASASQVVEVFPGISAPVVDALVRVKGGAGGLRVEDAGGSFFTYGQALDAGDYLRFDSRTGRAWVTDTDTWTGGVEVSGYIDGGPSAYPLELSPVFDSDPDDTRAVLTVTTTSRTSSPTIEVRGHGAHEI